MIFVRALAASEYHLHMGGLRPEVAPVSLFAALLALPAGAWAANPQRAVALPVAFEEYPEPSGAAIRFVSRGARGEVLLAPGEASMALPGGLVKMRFSGARGGVAPEPESPLPGASNYFTGGDPDQWRTRVRRYSAVRYRRLYPGIDALFYAAGADIEFDFVIAPGADPSVIVLEFPDSLRLRVAEDGSLAGETSAGAFRHRKPFAYQEARGKRRPVTAGYRLAAANRVTLLLGAYDKSLPLVIDPVLNFSTFLGGTGADGAVAAAVDAQGYLYVAGTTTSLNFPGTYGALRAANAGGQDVFVAKLSPDGTQLIYATYLGGSGDDTAAGIAIDGLGNAYVVGVSGSSNFPITAGAYRAVPTGVFVAKLSPAGTQLLYSTTIDDGAPRGIAVDGGGNAYVCGGTASVSFPVTAGALQTAKRLNRDAFITKVNSSGSALIYSTFLGGDGDDTANAIAVDPLGNAYVAGTVDVTGAGFPFTPGAFRTAWENGEAFVAKINAAGSALVFSTFLGGSSSDSAAAIAVDSEGAAYVGGNTSSTDFPVTAAAFQATFEGGSVGFAAKVGALGNTLLYSTFIAPYSCCAAATVTGVGVNALGQLHAVGFTASTSFPVTLDALQRYNSGLTDGFLIRLNAAGEIALYATYLGGAGDDYPQAVALDPWGNVYVAGQTFSSNFPTTLGAVQRTPTGAGDAFAAFINMSVTSCYYQLSEGGRSFAASGGSATVNVTAPAGCPWVASSSDRWVVITSGRSGAGPGSVTYSVGVNNSTTGRSARLTIAGITYIVTQSGATCTYTLQPASRSFTYAGGLSTFNLIAPTGCLWTAYSSVSWITLFNAASPTNGGSATVTFWVDANNGVARTGDIIAAGQKFTVTQSGAPGAVMRPSKIGVFGNGLWILDLNGNFGWDGVSTDRLAYFGSGAAGEIWVVGDWNGSGTSKIGVYVNGLWILDCNGNGVWDGEGADKLVYFGAAGWQPVVGDWNGDGKTEIGVYKDGTWMLDYDGNFAWNPPIDKMPSWGGVGYTPIVGDWNKSGFTKIGAYKDGQWLLDYNGDLLWNSAVDKNLSFGGAGYVPVVGDWNGDGSTKIGLYRDGEWVLDYNGNFVWDGASVDRFVYFGASGWIPVLGDWTAEGKTKIGVYKDGAWLLDYNGSFAWESPADKVIYFGSPGQTPVVGKW